MHAVQKVGHLGPCHVLSPPLGARQAELWNSSAAGKNAGPALGRRTRTKALARRTGTSSSIPKAGHLCARPLSGTPESPRPFTDTRGCAAQTPVVRPKEVCQGRSLKATTRVGELSGPLPTRTAPPESPLLPCRDRRKTKHATLSIATGVFGRRVWSLQLFA